MSSYSIQDYKNVDIIVHCQQNNNNNYHNNFTLFVIVTHLSEVTSQTLNICPINCRNKEITWKTDT